MQAIRKSPIVILAATAVVTLVTLQHVSVAQVLKGGGPSEILLPNPKTIGSVSVAEALARRRSHREFADRGLAVTAVSQLCWAAQGITDSRTGFRTSPSAGGLFPIAILIVDQAGVYEYKPAEHRLTRVVVGDVRKKLQAASLGQRCVGAAPVCMVVAFDVARTASKYGPRAERYCLLEAGHVAQNVFLQATALGIVGVPVGAFDDGKIASILRLPKRLTPIYLLPLGWPVVQADEVPED